MQWNDNMDEAPRDGTEIVGWNGIDVRPYAWLNFSDDDNHIGWCVAGYTDGGMLYFYHNVPDHDPTHWMPLPEPPRWW